MRAKMPEERTTLPVVDFTYHENRHLPRASTHQHRGRSSHRLLPYPFRRYTYRVGIYNEIAFSETSSCLAFHLRNAYIFESRPR